MPNWTNNILVVSGPVEQVQDFLTYSHA